MDYREVLQTGTMLDRKYRVDRVIGAGGFGITYQAFDIGLAAPVAIKEYYPAQFGMRDASMSVRPRTENDRQLFDRLRASFLREARTLAQFDHPSIVRVISVFESHGTAYMVMKYESGSSLKAWLQELGRQPTQGELDQLVWPLLDALEAMHRADFLHRDIAPDNIIVRADGSPVLLDFGASRRVYSDMSGTLTGVVKQGYSPQEQYSSDVRVQGPWTDVYAMGATLYLAVTGKVPTEATARMLDDGLLPATECARPGYRHGFLAGIDAAMSLRPKDRPQSVREWRDLLFFGTDDSVAVDPPGTYVVGMPGLDPAVPISSARSQPRQSQPNSTPSVPASGRLSQPRSSPTSSSRPSTPSSGPPGARLPSGADDINAQTRPSLPIGSRAGELARSPTGILAMIAGVVLVGGGMLWAIDAGGSNQTPSGGGSGGLGTVGPPITLSPERLGQSDAERRAKEEADRIVRVEAERKAREEAQRRAKEEADRIARVEAEKKAREEAQRRAKEEADRIARVEAEKKAREEAQRRAKEEADRIARVEAEKKAREEAQRRAKEEADRIARVEAEKKAREEAQRRAKEEADRIARVEAEKKAREEAQRRAKEEADRLARIEAEKTAREEAQRRAKEEADRLARIEAEKKAREEAQRRAKEEADRLARVEAEKTAREEAQRRAKEQAEQRAKELAERIAQLAAEREARQAAQQKAKEAADRAAARAVAEQTAREEAQRAAKAEAERIAKAAESQRLASLQRPPATPQTPAVTSRPVAKPLRAAAFSNATTGTGHFAQSLGVTANMVIAGGADGRLVVWDNGSGAARPIDAPHADAIAAVAVSKDRDFFATGAWNGEIRIWESATGKQRHKLDSVISPVMGLGYRSPTRLLAVHANGSWSIIEPGQGQMLLRSAGASDRQVTAGDVVSDGRTIAVALADGDTPFAIEGWQPANGGNTSKTVTLKGHSDWVYAVAVSPDTKVAASASADGTVRLWNWADGSETRKLAGHDRHVRAITFSADNRLVAGGGDGGRIVVWRVGSGEVAQTIDGPDSPVRSLVFSDDGKTLTGASEDGQLRVWQVEARP